jgi:hypothetical protein
MEPVSGIASVAGILEFSLVLTEHFSDLFQRFRDAHTDLDTLKGRLTCVRAEIASITQLSVQSEDWLLSPPAKIELVAALKAAEQDLIRLEGFGRPRKGAEVAESVERSGEQPHKCTLAVLGVSLIPKKCRRFWLTTLEMESNGQSCKIGS